MLSSVGLSLWRPELATLTAVLLVLGFALATTGIYFANRWVKKPRPEDVLDRALKGLDDRHRLYHYLDRGPAHLLLAPWGLVLFETRSGEGRFEFADGRWRQRITMGKAMRFFVEEPLGDPIADARQGAKRLVAALEARLGAADVPVFPVVVFTHPAAVLVRKNPPLAVCQPKQLRSELPKHLSPLPASTYDRVRESLDAGGPL